MSKQVILYCLTVLSLLLHFSAEAQSDFVYKLEFTDKGSSQSSPALSARALQHRNNHNIALDSLDYPVDTAYMSSIVQASGAYIHGSSRWLNAGYFITDDSASFTQSVQSFPFIKKISRVGYYPFGYGRATDKGSSDNKIKNESKKNYNYGSGQNPITLHNAINLHKRDYVGQGTLIAVLDDGFEGTNTNTATAHLYANNKILGTKNIARPSLDVYSTGTHGTGVMSIMAARADGQLVGTAPESDYALIVTEDNRSEQLIELENWAMGAEYADSLGAQVLNSSIAYNQFNNSSDDFDTTQLDGQTASVTIAALTAARKGMIVVASVGNEIGLSWHKILFPGDADSILAVGTVDMQKNHIPLSGVGPTADGRIKPDVVSLGTNVYMMAPNNQIIQSSGASLSTPIIAGFTACLIQVDPSLDPYSYVKLIREYSHLYTQPDSVRGYGVPNFGLLLELLDIPILTLPDDAAELYPNPSMGSDIQVQVSQKFDPVSYLLLDVTGAIIYESSVESRDFCIKNSLSSGHYTLIIKTRQGLITKQFVSH